ARPPGTRGVRGRPLAGRGRPVCAKPCRELEEGEEVPPPARRAPPFRHAITYHGHPDSLEAGEADEAEGGSEAGSVAQLGRLAETHRERAPARGEEGQGPLGPAELHARGTSA